MNPRTLRLVALTAALGALAWSAPWLASEARRFARATVHGEGPEVVGRNSGQDWKAISANDLSPNEARRRLARRFVLPPDPRALRAMELALGAAVEVEPDDGVGWLVGGGEGGRTALPDAASFEALEAMIEGALSATGPATLPRAREATAALSLDEESLFRALVRADQLAPTDAAAAKVLSARALARLALLLDDGLAFGDELRATALLRVVEARRVSGLALDLERGMVALALGYSATALADAERASDEPAWRAYLERDDPALAAAADGSPLARHLGLLRAAERDDVRVWHPRFEAARGRSDSPKAATLATALSLRSFAMRTYAASAMPGWLSAQVGGTPPDALAELVELVGADELKPVLDALRQLAARWPRAPGAQLADLDAALQANPLRGASAEVIALRAGYYRALAGRAWYELGLFYRTTVSSDEATAAFIAALEAPDPLLRALRAWLADLDALERGVAERHGMRRRVREHASLGESPVLEIVELEKQALGWGTPEAAELLRATREALDARPRFRSELGDIASARLHAAVDALRLWRSAYADDPRGLPGLRMALLQRAGDLAGLAAIADDPAQPRQDRVDAIERLAADDADPRRVARAFGALLRDDPGDDLTHGAACDWARESRDWPRLLDAGKRWRDAPGARHRQFAALRAELAVARAVLELGDPRSAWRIVEPTLESGHGAAFMVAIDTSLALGQLDQAERLARAARRRYPNGLNTATDLAEVLWARGEHDEAAEVLATARPWPTVWEWRDVVGATLRRRLEGDVERTTPALRALADRIEDQQALISIANAFAETDRPGLAFEVVKAMPARGLVRVDRAIRGRRLLIQAGRPDEAAAWLEDEVPRELLAAIPDLAYDARDHGLLWATTPDASDPDAVAWAWVLRAAAEVGGGERDAGRRAELVEWFESPAATGRFRQYGRVLLGLEPPATLADRVMTKRELVESAYFLAITAFAADDTVQGEAWLQVALDNGNFRIGEWRWAFDWARNLTVAGGDPSQVIARNAHRRPDVAHAPGPRELW